MSTKVRPVFSCFPKQQDKKVVKLSSQFKPYFKDNRIQLTIRQILFVSEYEYDRVPHLSVVDDPMKFLLRLVDAVPVRAIHYEY